MLDLVLMPFLIRSGRAPAEPVLFEIFRFVARIPNNIGMLIRKRYYRKPHPNLRRARKYPP